MLLRDVDALANEIAAALWFFQAIKHEAQIQQQTCSHFT